MISRLVLVSSVVATTAWAGGEKPIVDASHYVDESTVYFMANTGSDGYWVQAGGEAAGGEGDDALYLEVKQGGKLLSKIPCAFGGGRSENLGLDTFKCGEASQKALKAPGALQADLILRSDKDDKLYLLRTFKVSVKKWDNQDWQIDADDLLGPGYVAIRVQSSSNVPSPEFRFWLASGENSHFTTRCKVNGKSMAEISTSLNSDAGLGVDIIKGNKRTTWHWSHVNAVPDEQYLSVHKRAGALSFEENPGAWDCELRHNGAMIREFMFTVGKDGKPQPPSMQTVNGAPKLGPDVVQVDMRIGKDNGVDQRIKPDLIKKSRGFGLAWTPDDGLKTMLAALPAAYENQNPVAKKEKGKRLMGPDQNPPRFIDHSMAWLMLQRNGAGYKFSVEQLPMGWTYHDSDVYRLEWKQGGKLIATGKCGWNENSIVECHYDEKPLMAKGAIEATLILSDDTDGNEYVLNTYKVNVAKFTSYGDPLWQIVPDDVLATAWVNGQMKGNNIAFRFWVAADLKSPLKARCTVDGKKKVPDFGIGTQTDDPSIEAQTYAKKGDGVKYIWYRVSGGTPIAPGMPPADAALSGDYVKYLGEYPGSWECDVRNDGKVIRKLLFKVNDKGLIEPDPLQAGMPTAEGVVPIDLRFGKDIIDTRVRPDAMKKSRGFGLAWPKAPTKPFPPASGLPDPK
jgi:hypothetical protein